MKIVKAECPVNQIRNSVHGKHLNRRCHQSFHKDELIFLKISGALPIFGKLSLCHFSQTLSLFSAESAHRPDQS